jgi:purine-binding chemotaxis protein CheW
MNESSKPPHNNVDAFEQLLVFTVNEQRYALRLAHVERIVRAVEVMPLPEVSDNILGVINVQGQIIPVLSLRRWFRFSDREIELDDRFIIAHPSEQTIALLVDTIIGVVKVATQEIVPTARIAPGMEYSDGMLKLDNEMILIPNLNKLMRVEI